MLRRDPEHLASERRARRVALWKQRARQLKSETYALYLAYRDPRVPWYARVLGVCVVAYAISPIDLIPDFVPVLGYVDDLLLVPLGIALVLKMIPPEVMQECRARARTATDQGQPLGRIAAASIVAIWVLGVAVLATIAIRLLHMGLATR